MAHKSVQKYVNAINNRKSERDQLRDKLKDEERSRIESENVAIKLRAENARLKSLLREALVHLNFCGDIAFDADDERFAAEIREAVGEGVYARN